MEIFKDFGVSPLLLAAQIVNFVILLFLLKRFLYRPIMKVLDERKEKIENSLKEAAEIEQSFKEMEEKQKKMLEEARKQSSEIISEAKSEAKILTEQMQSSTKSQIEDTLKRTEDMLNLEREKMIQEARKEIVEMVVLTTEKVASSLLVKGEKEKMISAAVKEIKNED